MVSKLLGGRVMSNKIVVSLFVFVFISPFYVIGINTQLIAFLYFFGMFGLQTLTYSRVSLNKEVLTVFYILTVSAIIIYIIHGQINNYVNILFRFFTAFLICTCLLFSSKNLKEALTIISVSSFFHVIIIALQTLFPGFKYAWFSVVRNQANINLSEHTLGELAIRSNGVTGFLYASDGVVFVLSALILSVFFSRLKFLKVVYLALSFVCGRSSVFAAVLYFLYLIRSSSLYHALAKITFTIVAISVASFFIYVYHPYYFKWIFEPVINLLNGNELSQSFSATLNSHFFIFDNVFNHIFGYGIFTVDHIEYYRNGLFPSDSGFMRIYTSGGVFQLFVCVGSVILAYFRVYFSYSSRGAVNVSRLILILILVNLFFTIKSEFIYSNFNFLLLIILIIFKRRAIE